VLARLRHNPTLACFVATSFAGGIGLGLASKAGSVPIYAAAMLLAIAVVLLVDRRVTLTLPVLWSLAVWLALHLVGGLWVVGGDVVYAHWIIEPVVRYDNVVHAFGFGVAGLATLQAMRRSMPTPSPAAVFFVVWFGGMGLGAMNEVVEWVSTKLQTATNVGDFDNSMRDLAWNLIGAAAAGVWAATRRGDPAPGNAAAR
jgi:uncharacterized membrane protein YjdF